MWPPAHSILQSLPVHPSSQTHEPSCMHSPLLEQGVWNPPSHSIEHSGPVHPVTHTHVPSPIHPFSTVPGEQRAQSIPRLVRANSTAAGVSSSGHVPLG